MEKNQKVWLPVSGHTFGDGQYAAVPYFFEEGRQKAFLTPEGAIVALQEDLRGSTPSWEGVELREAPSQTREGAVRLEFRCPPELEWEVFFVELEEVDVISS